MKLETILDSLNDLADDGLRAVDERCIALLRQHDAERKEKAMNEARATLAAVGLSLSDLRIKSKIKAVKGSVYHGGHTYQHPTNKTLTWKGTGKKPGWLTALENEGKTAAELVNA